MSCCEAAGHGAHIRIAQTFRYLMAGGGCIWQASDQSAAQRILSGMREMLSNRPVAGKLFSLVVNSRMDSSVLWGGNIKNHKNTNSGNWNVRILYAAHARQIAPFAEVCTLNFADHVETCQHAVVLAHELNGRGACPAVSPASWHLTFGRTLTSIVRCVDTPGSSSASNELQEIAMDDARASEHLFWRERCGAGVPQPRLPHWPFGEEVLAKLNTCAVCTVGGKPGVGKSKKGPLSYLKALMRRYPTQRHGIVNIMELKEAQNALFAHVLELHPS